MAVDYRGQPITNQTAFTTTGIMNRKAAMPAPLKMPTPKVEEKKPVEKKVTQGDSPVAMKPDLSNLRRVELQKMVAEAKVANDWEERKKIFKRACEAEEEGRISLAIDLYKSLGRTVDVNRLLSRLKGD